jgi:uncharacterized cupin superfamily protein
MKRSFITKEDIDAMEGLSKTHFLNSNAQRVNKSLGDMVGLTGIGFHIIEVQPGHESTELHKHYFEDECVYILEGEAEAQLGQRIVKVKAGDFIGYPAGGLAHKLTNIGASILRCIVVGQRLDHDVADYPNLKKRIFRNKGLAWNLVNLEDIEEPNAGRKI